MELRYEQESYRNKTKVSNFLQEIQEPACRYPITLGNASRNALDQLILPVRFSIGEDETETDFEPGKPACFFVMNEDHEIQELNFQCHIDSVGEGFMNVAIPNASLLQSILDRASHTQLGLQLTIDTTTYNVMLDALSQASRSDDPRFLNLRNVLLGQANPRFRTLPRTDFPWLNTSQNEAIQKVLEAQDVAIVHGPPGTGKTTTLVEAIIETLQREEQVMVCAPSNAAVDWISQQLMRRGVMVLRIGNPIRMSDEMLECSYERRYAAHPDYSELWSIRRILREGFSDGKSREKQAKIRQLRERQTELEIKINADLFRQARVISCTLIGSAARIMERRHFNTLFIDEAAQALAPACWAAILKCNRVILCGDHQQLPPTVKSPEAARLGLTRTLMQEVSKFHPESVSLLTTQYRMHRDIMAFSSKWFYHNRLQAAPFVADRLVSPIDTPLLWVDTSQSQFAERTLVHTLSKTNTEEARLLIHILRDYIDMIGMEKIINQRIDFGIISPYKAQVRLLRRLLKMQRYFRTLKHQISVNSVDGFQGQERDVVILSMVRDNDKGSIGFLHDLRRMNVAMTRARMKLIIVGNTETLSRHPFYRQLIEYFQSKDSVLEYRPIEEEQ